MPMGADATGMKSKLYLLSINGDCEAGMVFPFTLSVIRPVARSTEETVGAAPKITPTLDKAEVVAALMVTWELTGSIAVTEADAGTPSPTTDIPTTTPSRFSRLRVVEPDVVDAKAPKAN